MNEQQEKEFSAKNILDEWNSVTGLLTNNSSYYFEVMSLIEDGYKAALTKCEEREKRLVDALKFYANWKTWKSSMHPELESYNAEAKNDYDKIKYQENDGDWFEGNFAGKRARQTLKELGYE